MPKTPSASDAPPDREALREAALTHIARYGATEAGLVRVLDRRIDRWLRATGAEPEAAAPARAAARDVARALAAARAIDDAAFAAARARRLARAGRSRRAVAAHLAAKGVSEDALAAALPSEADDALAALAYLRRRRRGPFRPGGETDAGDLASLARAGFSRPIAEAALALDPEEAERRLLALKQR